MNILENYIYIYHLNRFCVLPSMPDSISDSLSAEFSPTSALSRSAPIQSYIKSGPRTVSFDLDLHRDIMEDLNRGISNLKDEVVDFSGNDYVDTLIKNLQACVVPKYSVYKKGSKVVDPPQVAIRMSDTIFIRGVINGPISVTYIKPILDDNKYGHVKVTFTVTEVDPYDAPTVSMVGSFRGITSKFKSGIYKDKYTNISYNNSRKSTVSRSGNIPNPEPVSDPDLPDIPSGGNAGGGKPWMIMKD